eukprot:CAMPEP_0117032204 /NCGR_PEP_ID=MMETSP0472-20121206/23094_1 /TAXON_ID=693140 ORGANISM="Tiarina fusus, Strain LIS" /NCGR_SAMPLE_ID=MMETSP0472 /ASSEMBLY_ACC=CAM_ASM_000603 /LENGTH=503 /DNA_ID=CAMNT_0004740759 /DNA_START=21 /DNA_END=1532 /DNA_ORIENTATION=+
MIMSGSTPNPHPTNARVSNSYNDLSPQRGLNRTRGKIRLSAASRVLSGAGLATNSAGSNVNSNNNVSTTTTTNTRTTRTSVAQRPSTSLLNQQKQQQPRNNSLEDFLRGGMASMRLSRDHIPQVRKLRESLTRMCEESRRRISSTSAATTSTTTTTTTAGAGGLMNRGSFQCSVSEVGDDVASFGSNNTNSIRSSIFGSSIGGTSGSLVSKRASDRIRESLMELAAAGGGGTAALSLPPTFLQWCSSYDIDGVDIDEQRRQLELITSNNSNNNNNNLLAVACEDCPDCEEGKVCLACAPDPEEEAFGSFAAAAGVGVGIPEVPPFAFASGGDYLEEEVQEVVEEEQQQQEAEEELLVIEVAPGIRMSLKTPEDTWRAVLDGRITVTTCTSCACELTVADDAEVVVCTDCWVFSPVDQSLSTSGGGATTAPPTTMSSLREEGEEEEESGTSHRSLLDGPHRRSDSVQTIGSIDVGIKAETIFEWLEAQDSQAASGGDTTTILEE